MIPSARPARETSLFGKPTFGGADRDQKSPVRRCFKSRPSFGEVRRFASGCRSFLGAVNRPLVRIPADRHTTTGTCDLGKRVIGRIAEIYKRFFRQRLIFFGFTKLSQDRWAARWAICSEIRGPRVARRRAAASGARTLSAMRRAVPHTASLYGGGDSPSVQQRPPGGIGGVVRRRHLELLVPENVRQENSSAGLAAGIAEIHDVEPVRREGRALIVEAFGQNTLARTIRLHHADRELIADLLGIGDQVAARPPDRR